MISTSHSSARELLGEGGRFVVAGAINTAATVALYQVLLYVAPPWLAYSAAWVTGIAIIWVLYPGYVFRSGSTTRARFAITAHYALAYFASVALLQGFIAVGLHSRLAVFAVVAVMTPINFFVARWIYAARPERPVD